MTRKKCVDHAYVNSLVDKLQSTTNKRDYNRFYENHNGIFERVLINSYEKLTRDYTPLQKEKMMADGPSFLYVPLVKSLKSYDINRGVDFVGYFTRVCKNYIVSAHRKSRNELRGITLDPETIVSTADDCEGSIIDNCKLSDIERVIWKLMVDELNDKEIMNELKIKKGKYYDLKNHIKAEINQYYDALRPK